MTDRPTPDELFDTWIEDFSHGGVIKGTASEKNWRQDLRAAYKAGYTARMAERRAYTEEHLNG